jgi:hypothetical protein
MNFLSFPFLSFPFLSFPFLSSSFLSSILIKLRSEVASAAVAFVVQPSLAAQLGVPQLPTRPRPRLHLGQEQDDFDELDLEDS